MQDTMHVLKRSSLCTDVDDELSALYNELACDIFAHQMACQKGHKNLWLKRAASSDPSKTRDNPDFSSEIPAIPTDAFKYSLVFCFTLNEAKDQLFRTSGTSLGQRGLHAFRTLETYDFGAHRMGEIALSKPLFMADKKKIKPTLFVLGPSADEAKDSSLTHMFQLFCSRWRGHKQQNCFFIKGGRLLFDEYAEALKQHRAMSPDSPILLCATSFSYVHLLSIVDHLSKPPDLTLPPHSVVVHTGGFKGRSKEVEKSVLRMQLAHLFGVNSRDVISEYGMTELSSQMWELCSAIPDVPENVLTPAPWMRVSAVSPDTLVPLEKGQTGIARIEDLANVDSAVAIQTQDRIRSIDVEKEPWFLLAEKGARAMGITLRGSFELLGRLPGSTPRGCSLAISEMLQDAE